MSTKSALRRHMDLLPRQNPWQHLIRLRPSTQRLPLQRPSMQRLHLQRPSTQRHLPHRRLFTRRAHQQSTSRQFATFHPPGTSMRGTSRLSAQRLSMDQRRHSCPKDASSSANRGTRAQSATSARKSGRWKKSASYSSTSAARIMMLCMNVENVPRRWFALTGTERVG